MTYVPMLPRVTTWRDFLQPWPWPLDPNWEASARGAQADAEAWTPEKGGYTRHAKRVCSTCPVMRECGETALANDEPYSVWGGMTADERDLVRAHRANQPQASDDVDKPQEVAA